MNLPQDIVNNISSLAPKEAKDFKETYGEAASDFLLSDAGTPSYNQSREQQDLETRVSAGEFGIGRLTTRLPSGTERQITKSIAENWPPADQIYYWDHWWESDTNPIFSKIVSVDEDYTLDLLPDSLQRHPICPFLLYNYDVGFWYTPSFRQLFRAHVPSSQKHAFMFRIMNAYAEMALHKGYPKEQRLKDGTIIVITYPFTSFLKFFGVGLGRRLTATRGITLPPPRCMMHLMDAHRMMIDRWTSHIDKWLPIYRRFNEFLNANDLQHRDHRDTRKWRFEAIQTEEYVYNTFFKNN